MQRVQSIIGRVVGKVKREGFSGALRDVYVRASWRAQSVRWYLNDWWTVDRRFGIDTAGVESRYLRDIASGSSAELRHYEGTKWVDMRKMFDTLPLDPSQYTFVDIGCGKGRAMVFAAELGFPRIVGVELAPTLADTTRRNVQSYLSRSANNPSMDVHEGDALAFQLPEGNLAIFMYNPFGGSVMEAFVQKVEAHLRSRPDVSLYVLYMRPECADTLAASPALRTHATDGAFMVYARRSPAPAPEA